MDHLSQNKSLVTKLYAAISNGKTNEAVALFSKDMQEHERFPEITLEREKWKGFIHSFKSAFPDAVFDVMDLIAEKDRVSARVEIRGTHEEPFKNIPATGKKFSINAIDIFRFSRGRIVEHWGVMDEEGLIEQLTGKSPAASIY